MNKVSKIKFGSDLKQVISDAVNQIGGFKSFINPGEIVLLKPNFNTADSYPASSDPEFLKAVVELVYDCGAQKVIIGESSTFSLKTFQVMEKLKIFDFKNMKPSPEIYAFEKHKWIKKEIPGGKYLKNISVTEFLDKVDKLILLPCLKTHAMGGQFTGSLKLSIGFVKKSERIAFHMKNIQEKVGELNKIINPDLIIMDARKCFINGGPAKGELRQPNLILASTDRIAIDIEGIKIIQGFPGNSLEEIDPLKIKQIKRAIEIGV